MSLQCVSQSCHSCSGVLLDLEKLLTSACAGNGWRKEVRAEALVNITFCNVNPCHSHTRTTHKMKRSMKRKTTKESKRKAFLVFIHFFLRVLLQLGSSSKSRSISSDVLGKSAGEKGGESHGKDLTKTKRVATHAPFPVCYNIILLPPSWGTCYDESKLFFLVSGFTWYKFYYKWK